MIKFISFSFIFLLLLGLTSRGQTIIKLKSSNLKVSIKLLNTTFRTGDSVKFQMTITNLTKSTQKFLFDKPTNHKYPWITSVSLNRESGTPVQVTTWALLSSHLYFENQLKGFYRKLKPKQSFSHNYYLGDIVRFDNEEGTLPKGTYILQVIYDYNFSNKVIFTIK